MLASVLHMSNLEFDKVDHEQGEIASISDREVTAAPARMPHVHQLLARWVAGSLGRRARNRSTTASVYPPLRTQSVSA